MIDRYRRAVLAGHRLDVDAVRALAGDDEPLVRQAALSALARLDECSIADLERGFADRSPEVRARAAELSIAISGIDPARLLADPDSRVVEVSCFACGEIEWHDHPPVEPLSRVAREHTDPLCRESAAAALGAIGHPDGLDAVLAACSDRVTVRRRATLALAAFDDARAEDALRRALDDKDWQVRQAAEDLLEVGRVLDGPEDPDAYADQAG